MVEEKKSPAKTNPLQEETQKEKATTTTNDQISYQRSSKPIKAETKSENKLSIFNILNEEESTTEDKISQTKERLNKPFTEKDILLFIEEYKNDLEQNSVFLNILNTTSVKLNSKNVLIFEFLSFSALDEFNEYKEEFFFKMREKLQNDNILSDFIIAKTEKSFILTPKDVYNKMKTINPLLEKFNQNFRLDI